MTDETEFFFFTIWNIEGNKTKVIYGTIIVLIYPAMVITLTLITVQDTSKPCLIVTGIR